MSVKIKAMRGLQCNPRLIIVVEVKHKLRVEVLFGRIEQLARSVEHCLVHTRV